MNIVRKTLKTLLTTLGYEIRKIPTIPELSDFEHNLINITSSYTMTGRMRQWALIQSIRHVSQNKIEGDIVECGVWRGGNLILAGLMREALPFKRKIWGFDTFAGMSEPTKDDVSISGEIALEMYKKKKRKEYVEWCYSSIDQVRENFVRVVGNDNVILVKGKVEETLRIEQNIPKKIAILRLDTDWYESTKIELETLFPKISKAGVLIIDDYGRWRGARRAVNEYFDGKHVWLHRVDHSCRLLIKDF